MNFSVPSDVVLSIYMYMNNFLVRPTIDRVSLTTKYIVVGRQNHISTQKGPKARWPMFSALWSNFAPLEARSRFTEKIKNQTFG